MLNLYNVSSSYNQTEVLKNISISVNPGEIISILGANASGKTTLLKTIIGMTKVINGEIIFNHKNITNTRTEDIIYSGISIVPENRRLFPKMTIEENLRIVPRINWFAIQTVEWFSYIRNVFPILNDKSRGGQLAGTLSGGEQQQVAIARALLSKPEILLLDEPSMGLTVKLTKENFRILKAISKTGVGILMVEQNVKMALMLSKRAYVLQEGQIILEGRSNELLNNKLIQQSYLGEFIPPNC